MRITLKRVVKRRRSMRKEDQERWFQQEEIAFEEMSNIVGHLMEDLADLSLQHDPRVSEEHVPLSSHQGAPSGFSGRLLVDTNLDTSSADTYRPLPASLPFNVTSGATQTAPVAQEISCDNNNTSLLSTNSNPVQEPSSNSEEEVDPCPICLEEFDVENPQLATNCDHHFHLACILEWMERSGSCPLCNQVIVLSPGIV